MILRGVQEFEELQEFRRSDHDDFAPIFENRWSALAFLFAMTKENMLEITSEVYFRQDPETF